MIRDDHVDVRRVQREHGLTGTRAAVAGHHQRRAGAQRGLDARAAQIVAIGETIRHERHDMLSPEAAQYPNEQCGGAHTVDVVVAVHENRFLRADRVGDPLDGSGQMAQRVRRRKVFESRSEKSFCRIDVRVAARHE